MRTRLLDYDVRDIIPTLTVENNPFDSSTPSFFNDFTDGVTLDNLTGIGAQDYSHDVVFSVTDADTVEWAAGTLTLSNGRGYSIAAGNTGNMSALTYIYFDLRQSQEAFQTSTTYDDAVGEDRLLIATAQNGTVEPYFRVFGGTGGFNFDTLSVNKLTAGTINSQSIVLGVTGGSGDVEIRSGISTGDFDNSDVNSGFILGIDDSDGDTAKFYIGDGTNYLEWDGSTLTIEGTVGGSVSADDLTGTVGLDNTNVAAQGWTFTGTFTASDANTVAWGAGTFTTAAGTNYSISGNNTGNMTARTYIYLDIGTSTTELQTTTNAATAIGSGKVLIAVAEDSSDVAEFIVFGGRGDKSILVDHIAANSSSTNEFVSNTAQIANLVVTNAKINDLAVSKLTAGTISSQSIVLGVSGGSGDVEIRSGIASGDFDNSGAASGFILGVDDSDSDLAKLYVGNATDYMEFDGSTFEVFADNTPQLSKGTFGGDGSDGALSTSGGTVDIDCSAAATVVKNYTSITVATNNLTFSNPNSRGTVVILKSQGDVTISATVDMSGMGAAGGAGATAAVDTNNTGGTGNSGWNNLHGAVPTGGTGGTGDHTQSTDGQGGGGAGAASLSNNGTDGEQNGGGSGNGTGGTANPVPYVLDANAKVILLVPGAGGGGGGNDDDDAGGAGGRGGGAILIECAGSLNFTGTITVAGDDGSDGSDDGDDSGSGAGGGGAGGTIWILYNSLTANSGTLTVSGGMGGTSGGLGLGDGGDGGDGASKVQLNTVFA